VVLLLLLRALAVIAEDILCFAFEAEPCLSVEEQDLFLLQS
jgi:hypothetical protein